MFKVDVFVKTLDGEWIVTQTRFDDFEKAEQVADYLRASLYNQYIKMEIQDYRTMVYDESKYINAE